ncbi:MAG: hypothetical protein H8E76_05455 [Helicobacteraceae bacterium]|nr:hypothetical protein [Candidatus Sulfurimonas ponti]MBL6972825.1 hypothetical protein [Sulfurimonas sp.]
MKTFLFALITLIFISGCATKNAFTKLGLEDSEQKAIENTRCAKVISGDIVGGIFSAIYLNNIYEDINKEHKMFYISMYLKEKSDNFNVTLNNEKPIQIKKLPDFNKYSHLLPSKNKWTQNYLVTFKSAPNSDLNLSIDSGQYSSGPLSYSKDQQ